MAEVNNCKKYVRMQVYVYVYLYICYIFICVYTYNEFKSVVLRGGYVYKVLFRQRRVAVEGNGYKENEGI